MNGISVCNHPSLLLNYVVYLSNILQNKTQSDKVFFPYFENSEEVDWNMEDLEHAWAISLKKYEEGTPVVVDSTLAAGELIHNTLFPNKPVSSANMLDSFLAWWWSYPCGGKEAIERLSDPIMLELWDELATIKQERTIGAQSKVVTVHFLYGSVPNDRLPIYGNGYIIVSLGDLLDKGDRNRQLALDIMSSLP